MKDRKRISELKATLKGKNQKVKYLRKRLRVNKLVFEDYHNLINELKSDLIESQRKKWYQFKKI